MLLDQVAQTYQRRLVQLGRLAPAVRLRRDRPGLALPLPHDHGRIHQEQPGQVPQRVAAPLDGRHDPFPQIVGERSHEAPPHGLATYYGYSIPRAIRTGTALDETLPTWNARQDVTFQSGFAQEQPGVRRLCKHRIDGVSMPDCSTA